MQGVSNRTRSRNATRFQSLDDIVPFKRRKKVLKNDQREKGEEVIVVDVEKGDKSEEREESNVVVDKGGTFSDDRCGLAAENPIVIGSDADSVSDDDNIVDHDGNDDDHDGDNDVYVDDNDVYVDDNVNGGGDEDDDGLCSSSDEEGTSDEDFEGSESSSSEETCGSYDDNDDDEEEEEEVVVVRKVKSESNGMRRGTKDDVNERKYEKVEEGDFEKSPSSSVNNNESGVEDQEELKHAESATASVSSNSLEKESSFEKDGFDSSNLYEGAERKGVKRVRIEVVSDDDDIQVIEVEEQKNKKRRECSLRSQQNVQVFEEIRDSTKVHKSQRKKANEKVGDNVKLDSHMVDNRPMACGETLPLIWSLKEESEPVEISNSEEEVELWEELDISLKVEEEIDSLVGNIGANETTSKNMRTPTSLGEQKGCSESKSYIEKEGSYDYSKLYEGAEKNEEKGVEIEVKIDDDDDDDVQVIDFSMFSEVKARYNKKKEYPLRSRRNEAPVPEERGGPTKVWKSQKKNANANEKVGDSVKLDLNGRKVHNVRGNAWRDRKYDGDHSVNMVRHLKPNELHRHLAKLLAECYSGEKNSKKRDSIGLKEQHRGDVHMVDTPPPACEETVWSLAEKAEPLEKSKDEEEMDKLWEQMDISLKEEEIVSQFGNIGTDEASPKSRRCQTYLDEHKFYLDEEIGEYCTGCGFVKTEIKNISPPVVDRFPFEESGNRMSPSGVKGSLFDESLFNDYDGDSEAFISHKEGTVWDLIPGVKQSLYPHQQEGFEFIWKNLAGTIELKKLESPDRYSEGGCIISHYPGTGKTRLTIMFLKTYLKLFPKCRPVIVAPSSLLLTWEDEFKNWNIGVPFHNLNNPELSGKEDDDVVNSLDRSNNPQRDIEALRMVKLCSWFNEKSILGISYHLYEQLAGSKTTKKKGKLRKVDPKMKEKNKIDIMGKVLRELPGLLVLDEGHMPRNEKSCIWKALVEEVQTKKRIILSGTPFQNNFFELYNTLTLVKPSFPDTIPPKLKKFCRNRQTQKKKPSEELSWEPISSGNNTAGNLANDEIRQLKSRMDSFVHVHSGNILKKKLPGLRKCLLTLKPDSFQKEILDSIESCQKVLKFEHKLALVSVHPSLFLGCKKLTKKEKSIIDKERLKKLVLNPYGGVKTRFVVEFVRLCDAVNEKVIVFSQFIKPLRLLRKQLKSVFNWCEGKEVLYMSGTVDSKDKQSRIHTFNDPNSEAKIMLASTKACNEGISLVGASRVVLLDVVWNPSVERQAISRAFRLGQKKVVYTYHLITEGTTERTKYHKQAEKVRLSELVFSDKNATENDVPNTCAVDFEDRVLDQMIKHEKLKDMFGERVVEP